MQQQQQQNHPICVECGASLGGGSNKFTNGISEHLYNPAEKILKQCPRCGNTCDPFLETDQVVTGLNVALLRKSAWRHIIHNNLPNETYFLIAMFAISILLETMVALCWKKSAMKMINDDDLVLENIGMKRLSALVSSMITTNSTSSSAILLSAVFSVASSAYSTLVCAPSSLTTSTSSSSTSVVSPLPPLAFLQPYISTTVEALLPITTPPTLQISNSSNPFYYSSPRTADANNHFISEVQQHKKQKKQNQKTQLKGEDDDDAVLEEQQKKVDLFTFVLTSPVMSPSALETMRMMSLLGFCAVAEVVLFLIAIVALMSSSARYHSHGNNNSNNKNSSNSNKKKKSLSSGTTADVTTKQSAASTSTSATPGVTGSTIVVSRPLSATAITRSVLVAQCARLAFLPFFIWSIPLDLLPLIECTQILWYYLASGALTIEDDRIRRWLTVALMLFLRSMFRIVTQWAPIVGWF